MNRCPNPCCNAPDKGILGRGAFGVRKVASAIGPPTAATSRAHSKRWRDLRPTLRFMVPMRGKKKWRLSMDLSRKYRGVTPGEEAFSVAERLECGSLLPLSDLPERRQVARTPNAGASSAR